MVHHDKRLEKGERQRQEPSIKIQVR